MLSGEDALADSSQPTVGAQLGMGFLLDPPDTHSADRQGVLSQRLPPPATTQEARAHGSPNCPN